MGHSRNLQINIIDLAIPVQAFRFEYTLVKQSDLPIIKEFILRLLKLGRMTPDKISHFLGMSEGETRAALSQLAAQKEISIGPDGTMGLTSASMKYFEGGVGNRPKVPFLHEDTKTFTFDLLNFDHIKSSIKTGNSFRALKIVADAEIKSNSAIHAKQSFSRGYIDIFDKEEMKFDGDDNLRSIELYKLSDVRKSREGHIRISLSVELDLERNAIEWRSEDQLLESNLTQKKLTELLNLTSTPQNIVEVGEASYAFQDTLTLPCLSKDGLDAVDFSINSNDTSLTNNNTYFLGSAALQRNWDLIASRLDKYSKDRKNKFDLLWIAPTDKYWMLLISMQN